LNKHCVLNDELRNASLTRDSFYSATILGPFGATSVGPYFFCQSCRDFI
jgi:hypothetical protein